MYFFFSNLNGGYRASAMPCGCWYRIPPPFWQYFNIFLHTFLFKPLSLPLSFMESVSLTDHHAQSSDCVHFTRLLSYCFHEIDWCLWFCFCFLISICRRRYQQRQKCVWRSKVLSRNMYIAQKGFWTSSLGLNLASSTLNGKLKIVFKIRMGFCLGIDCTTHLLFVIGVGIGIQAAASRWPVSQYCKPQNMVVNSTELHPHEMWIIIDSIDIYATVSNAFQFQPFVPRVTTAIFIWHFSF